MIEPIKIGYHWILDALFPRRCLGCKKFGTYCCAACLGTLEFSRQLHCPACGLTNPLGEFCEDCLADKNLNGLWVTLSYGNPLVREMIRQLKFSGLTELVEPLGNLLIATLKTFNLPPAWHSIPKENWFLTPVPLHSRRERDRNFNQATLLAQKISGATGLAISPTLKRSQSTLPQSNIKDDEERKNNIKNAFELIADTNVVGRAYILIDDVYTSGSTLEACAKVLKQNGASETWGLVVAKG